MDEKTNIREFAPHDAEIILEIHEESAESFEDIGINKEFILIVSQRYDYRFLVAEIDKRVVGFVGILFHMNVGRGEIGPICVCEEYRDKGIGKEMLDKAILFLKDLGIRRVTAKVKTGNEEGIDFFKKNGFEQEGFFKDYSQKNEDVIQLVRFIY